MAKSAPKRDVRGWLALGAVLLGLLYVVAGVWVLSRSSSARAARLEPQETATPVLPATPTALATATRRPDPTPTPQASNTPVEPTSTATSTPLPSPTASKPVVEPGDGILDLTIVHTNDAWGYLLPCG
jgi:hypothetical protein